MKNLPKVAAKFMADSNSAMEANLPLKAAKKNPKVDKYHSTRGAKLSEPGGFENFVTRGMSKGYKLY